MFTFRQDWIKFEKNLNNLGNQIVVPVPFTFRGVNTTDQELEVEVKPSCGCIVVEYNDTVPIGGTLEINGTFTKTAKANHTKTIAVRITKGEDKQDIQLVLKVTLI